MYMHPYQNRRYLKTYSFLSTKDLIFLITENKINNIGEIIVKFLISNFNLSR